MYQIDKNIPLQRITSKYPLGDMEVGDSFFVPYKDDKDKLRNSINMSIQAFKRKNKGHKFALRSIEDGFRIWRVS